MAGVDMFITHYFLVGISSITISVNLPVVTLILAHPRLRRSKEVILICLVCLADLSNATAFFTAGIHRLNLIVNNLDESTWPNRYCARYVFSWLLCANYQLVLPIAEKHFIIDFSSTFVGLSITSISADRFVAVMLPIRYRQLSVSYAYAVFGGSLALTICGVTVCGVIWLMSPPLQTSAMCFAATMFTPGIFQFMAIYRMTTIAAAVVLYVPITIRIYRLVKSLSKITPKEQESNRALFKMTMVVGITLTFEFTLVWIPDFVLETNFLNLRDYQMIGYLIICTKGFVNIFLYTFKTEEIRHGCETREMACENAIAFSQGRRSYLNVH